MPIIHQEKIQKNPEFYYEIVTPSLEEGQFVSYPGLFQVNRLGKTNLFKLPGTIKNSKPKTIVFCDPTIARNVYKDLRRCTIQLLDELFELAFDLRFWTGDRLIKISKKSQIGKKLPLVKATNEKNLVTALALENKPSQALFYSDYFATRKLIKELDLITELTCNTLYLCDFTSYQTLSPDVLEWLYGRELSLQFFYPSNLVDNKIKNIFNLFCQHVPEQISSLNADCSEDISILESIITLKQLKNLKLKEVNSTKQNGHDFLQKFHPHFQFNLLSHLSLKHSKIPISDFMPLLQTISNTLTEIEFDSCDITETKTITPAIAVTTLAFPTLFRFSCIHSNLPQQLILNLIKHSPQLKELFFREIGFLPKEDQWLSDQIANTTLSLERLELKQFPCGSQFIAKLIENSSKLETLILDTCFLNDTLNLCFDETKINPARLTKLEVQNSKIQGDELAKLIHWNQQHLKSLTLSRKYRYKLALNKLVSLPQLTELIYVMSTSASTSHNTKYDLSLPLGAYLKLISCAPNLHKLDFRNVRLIELQEKLAAIDWTSYSFAHIQKVNLSGSNLPLALLLKILKEANPIKKLKVSLYDFEGKLTPEDIPDGIFYNNLTEISLSSCPGPFAAKLMSCAPNLKKLNLENKRPDFNLSSYPISFLWTHLEKFSGQYLISLKEKMFLFNKSPRLQELFIGYQDLSSVPLEHIYFNFITSLILSLLRPKEIPWALLMKFPNLQELSLKKPDQEIQNELREMNCSKQFCLPYLHTLSLEHTGISTATLYQLIQATRAIKSLRLFEEENLRDFTPDLLAKLPQLNALVSFYCYNAPIPLLTNIKLASSSDVHFNDDWSGILSRTVRSTAVSNVIELPTIEALIFNSASANCPAIEDIITVTPNLKSLVITTAPPKQNKEKLLQIIKNAVANLEHFVAHNFLVDDLFYIMLIQSKPFLKELVIKNHSHLSPTSLNPFILDHMLALENLQISESVFHAPFVRKLLSHSPKLKKLILGFATKTEDVFTDVLKQNLIFEELTELTLSNTTLNPRLLEKLLLVFPNLKTLKIYHCDGLKELSGLALPKTHLCFNLKDILIFNTNIDATYFATLLPATPSLKSIHIKSPIRQNFSLDWLKNLPKLKKLILDTFTIESSAKPDAVLSSLRSLTNIDFSYSSIHFDLLITILNFTQQLEQLKFSHSRIDDISAHFDYQTLRWPKNLTTLISIETNLPLPFLVARHLEFNKNSFHLWNTIVSDDHLAVCSAWLFREETTINGDDVKFSPFSFYTLLHIARNVKNLELTKIRVSQETPVSQTDIQHNVSLVEFPKLIGLKFDHVDPILCPHLLLLRILQTSPVLQELEFANTDFSTLNPEGIPEIFPLHIDLKVTFSKCTFLKQAFDVLQARLPNAIFSGAPHIIHSPISTVVPNQQSLLTQQTVVKKVELSNQVETSTQAYQTRNICYPFINPSLYRQDVRYLQIQNGSLSLIEKPIDYHQINVPISSEPLVHSIQHLFEPDDHDYCFVAYSIKLSSAWQKLQSITPTEALICFYAQTESLIEIGYSDDANFYAIRATTPLRYPITITIQYLLKLNEKNVQYPSEIQKLINYCQSFPNSPQKVNIAPGSNDIQSLEARFKQKAGSCYHRSIALAYKLKSYSPYLEVRLIANQDELKQPLHQMIEIKLAGTWQKIDLGGYACPEHTANKEFYPFQQKDNQIATKSIPLTDNKETSDLLINLAAMYAYHQLKKQTITKKTPTLPTNVIDTNELMAELITWSQVLTITPEFLTTLFPAISRPYQQTLFHLNSSDDALAIVAAFAKSQRQPFLFIDEPEDLQWRAPGLTFTNQITSPVLSIRNAFSKLRHFLTRHPNGILFINWSPFSHTKLAALHCILDDKRSLESENFPGHPIISFYCPTPYRYKGNDFFSRFTCEFSLTEPPRLNLFLDRVRPAPLNTSPETLVVELFHSEDWEMLLFGSLNIAQKPFAFKATPFLNALGPNNPIPCLNLHLVNPPWHLRAFSLFWQHALQQNSFSLYGRDFNLHPSFQVTYSLEATLKTEVIQYHSDNNSCFHYPLNSQTFHEFFPHYSYQNGAFHEQQGLLAQHRNIELLVTESLSLHHWYRLLHQAQHFFVTLTITLCPDVTLPSELAHVPYNLFNPIQMSLDLIPKEPHLSFIIAQNTLSVAHHLLSTYPKALYVELDDGHDFKDLFFHIHGNLTPYTIEGSFHESVLFHRLQMGDTLIINATFPLLLSLQNNLAKLIAFINQGVLLINHEKVPLKGRCFFIISHPLNFLATTYFDQSLNNQPYCHSVRQAISLLPSFTLVLPTTIPEYTETLDFEAYIAYRHERFLRIIKGFNQSPLIFYTGPTGIGKTTYIIEEFTKDYLQITGRKATLFFGLSSLASFTQYPQKNGDAFLVIDEANLCHEKLSFLKACKSMQPHLLYNAYYSQFFSHQFIFLIGNSKSYGDNRQQQDFINTHAELVTCPTPNNAYFYHQILKPALNALPLNSFTQSKPNTIQIIANTLLDFFNCTNQLTQQPEPLLSQRHLHIMAIIARTYFLMLPDKTHIAAPSLIALQAAFDVVGNLLSPQHKSILLNNFAGHYGYDNSRFSAIQRSLITSKIDNSRSSSHSQPFTVTETRYPILHLLDTFISLRNDLNFHFGILLEGSSAAGKSALCQFYLDFFNIPYIQFSFGNNFESNQKALLRAYFQHQVIWIDEFNAGAAQHEKLLNAIIMKTEPELRDFAQRIFSKDEFELLLSSYSAPSQSLVIVTQNDLTTDGREPISPALKARLTHLFVPDYLPLEIQKIFLHKGAPQHEAALLTKAFFIHLEYAKFHQHERLPTLRKLLPLIEAQYGQNTKEEMKAEHVEQQTKFQAILKKAEKLIKDHLLDHTPLEDLTPQFLIQLFYDARKPNHLTLKSAYEKNIQAMRASQSTLTFFSQGQSNENKEQNIGNQSIRTPEGSPHIHLSTNQLY